ncbi:MAG: dTMP kinase [Halanaerobiaceae bacterium]
MDKGKLIVIESGTDGSGKTTQFNKLYGKLKEKNYPVHKVEFPDYASDSSALVKMYLQGDFGEDPSEVNLYAASTFFAVDRFVSYQKKWQSFYREGKTILADRYTTSNMIHQASKISDKEEKEEYLSWLRDLEFVKFQLPIPDLVIFLDMPPEYSVQLLKKRGNQDIHERDVRYLTRTYRNALEIAREYGWSIISCIDQGEIKPVEEIHREVYTLVKKII